MSCIIGVQGFAHHVYLGQYHDIAVVLCHHHISDQLALRYVGMQQECLVGRLHRFHLYVGCPVFLYGPFLLQFPYLHLLIELPLRSVIDVGKFLVYLYGKFSGVHGSSFSCSGFGNKACVEMWRIFTVAVDCPCCREQAAQDADGRQQDCIPLPLVFGYNEQLAEVFREMVVNLVG